MKILYTTLIVIALAIVVYVYGIAFDSFSETVLVQITPLWFFFLIFGIYGFVAEKINKNISSGKSETVSKATSSVINAIPLIGPIFMFPLYFVKGKNSLVVALIGSLIWGVLLFVFFQFVFPQL